MISVERPVVRQFKHPYAENAARHVRDGGHAIVWEKDGRARLVFPIPKDDDPMDLGYWSLLDLGKYKYAKNVDGPYRGLASAFVPRELHHIVRRRAERDSIWPGPTHETALDCLACGSCCRDNEVELEKDDIERFRAAGRHDLVRQPYARKRKDGKLVLRLLRSKSCRHLASDNKCGIYELRPSACSLFPVASECCLFSREMELEIYDGLPPQD